VGNLLDVARLESGKIMPRLDWHDARDVVQTTLRELQRELSAHPVKLEMPTEPMLVRLDFSLVQHALANLLMNAATHTPPGTPVEVQANFAEESLVLSVADRGPGIPAELLPRLRQIFVRPMRQRAAELRLTLPGICRGARRNYCAANRPGGGAISLRLPQREKPHLSNRSDEHAATKAVRSHWSLMMNRRFVACCSRASRMISRL
jgi:two-component system sensor histidine kinase KdpD